MISESVTVRVIGVNAALLLNNSDRREIANFYAGLTAQTFIHLNWLGFSINQLNHGRRTTPHAFFAPGAFVLIYKDIKHIFLLVCAAIEQTCQTP